MPEQNIHIGDYLLNSLGSIDLTATGKQIALRAVGEGSVLSGTADTNASIAAGSAILTLENNEPEAGIATMQAGAAGQVNLGAGLPEVGAFIRMEAEAIVISCGAPGVGASIKLTPESITLQVAEVTLTLTPEGITEDVFECTRELTAEGHNFQAAETELNVGVSGEAKEAPTEEAEIEAGRVDNETMGSHTSDAMKNDDAGISMTV